MKKYVFDFLHLKFFSFRFYNNLFKFIKIFPSKTAYKVKNQNFFFFFFFFLFYGLDMELEPEP
jgi:hypothetical protein